MTIWLMNTITYILSRSPILSITIDEEFHEIAWGDYDFKEVRISLINFGVGFCKVYLGTWKNGKFNLIKIIKIDEIKTLPDIEEIEEKANKYSEYISDKSIDILEVETEFLQYKIGQSEATKELALNKINTYCAIILVLLPLIFTYINKLESVGENLMSLVTFLSLLYCMFNISALILDFYKVRSYNRVAFKDIKGSTEPRKVLALSYYKEWYSIKAEAPLYVTYVRNIERYLKLSVLFFILLGLSINYNMWSDSILEKYDNVVHISEAPTDYVDDIVIDQDKLSKRNLDSLITIQNLISTNHYSEILIIGNVEKKTSIGYNQMIEAINTFNHNDIRITEIIEKRSQDDLQNKIKIILLGERK